VFFPLKKRIGRLRDRMRLKLGAHSPRQPWTDLVDRQAAIWNAAKEGGRGGPRVLIAPSMGGFQHGAFLESILAAVLTLRGARVDVLLCDSFLPACQLTEITNTSPDQLIKERPQPRCASCYPSGKKMFDPLRLPVYWYSQLVEAKQVETARRIAAKIPIDELGEYRLDGLAVGEHALAGALRYVARGDLKGEPESEKVVRCYLEASLLSVFAIQRLLQQNSYDVACFNHGLYVPQGLIGEVCRQQGVRVVNWNPAYRQHCFIFSHGDTYHHTMVSEPTGDWENIAWTSQLEARTLEYLKSRWQGTQDWIWFHDQPQEDINRIATELGLDFSRPWVTLLTSVMWDAQLHYRSKAFPHMLEWVLQTIAYFAKRPELQLIIRVHPAEVRGLVPSRQLMATEIANVFPVLPPNVFLVPPESRISTYAIVERCNAALIYNTKTGIEISSMGVPVVVAGEAWIRNKGFSLDATSPGEYFQILDRLPLAMRLSALEVERARKYAFHFFFRRMIPLPFIKSATKAEFSLILSGLQELGRGNHPGLDVISDGILEATPFIYPAERLPDQLS
jgi:hypothetical protein